MTPDTLKEAAPAETPEKEALQKAVELLSSKRPEDREEGERALRGLAASGDPRAMVQLAECLFEGGAMAKNPREGEEWMRKASDGGCIEAMVELSNRLLEGRGVKTNTREGELLLRKAADLGDSSAMFKLGERLSNGLRLAQNREEGRKMLERAAEAGNVDGIASLGLVSYRDRDYRRAAELFLRALKMGAEGEGNNLAYMLRRGEIPADIEVPPVADLLKPLIEQKSALALVNQALVLAAGIQCEASWEAADEVMGQIPDRQNAQEVVTWWWELAESGDPEGHLVVGWLVRRGLVDDPNRHPVARRMNRARKGGWQVPAWMDQPAPGVLLGAAAMLRGRR